MSELTKGLLQQERIINFLKDHKGSLNANDFKQIFNDGLNNTNGEDVYPDELYAIFKEAGIDVLPYLIPLYTDIAIDNYTFADECGGDVSSDTIRRFLDGDYIFRNWSDATDYDASDVAESYFNDNIADINLNTLSKLGITNKLELENRLSEDEDLLLAFNEAISYGQWSGAEGEAYNDINSQIEFGLGTDQIRYTGNECIIKYTNFNDLYSKLDCLFEGTDFASLGTDFNKPEDIVRAIINSCVNIEEPYYGWEGWDVTAFNEKLESKLDDLKVKGY